MNFAPWKIDRAQLWERQKQEHVAAEKEKQKEAENAERAQRVAGDALNRSSHVLQERRPPSTRNSTQHLW